MVFNGALCESNGFCVHSVIEQDLVEEFLNHDLLNSKALEGAGRNFADTMFE